MSGGLPLRRLVLLFAAGLAAGDGGARGRRGARGDLRAGRRRCGGLALRERVLPLRLGGRRGPARTGRGLGGTERIVVVAAGGRRRVAPVHRHHVVEVVGAAIAVGRAGSHRLLLPLDGKRIVPAVRGSRGLPAAVRAAGGDRSGSRRRRGRGSRGPAARGRRGARRGGALDHVDDAVVASSAAGGPASAPRPGRRRRISGFAHSGVSCLIVGLRHRRAPCPPTSSRLSTPSFLPLGLRGRPCRLLDAPACRPAPCRRRPRSLLLLGRRLFLEQLVDELVVGRLHRRRRRRRPPPSRAWARSRSCLPVLALARTPRRAASAARPRRRASASWARRAAFSFSRAALRRSRPSPSPSAFSAAALLIACARRILSSSAFLSSGPITLSSHCSVLPMPLSSARSSPLLLAVLGLRIGRVRDP